MGKGAFLPRSQNEMKEGEKQLSDADRCGFVVPSAALL